MQATRKQLDYIRWLIGQLGYYDEDELAESLGCQSLGDLSAREASDLIDRLKKEWSG